MNKCNFAANRNTDVKDKQVSLAGIHVLILEETCLEQGELYGNPDADHIKLCQSKKRNVKVWLTCSWKGVVGKIDKLESHSLNCKIMSKLGSFNGYKILTEVQWVIDYDLNFHFNVSNFISNLPT